jgi:outer membrane biogenesis lipoprotein LolB
VLRCRHLQRFAAAALVALALAGCATVSPTDEGARPGVSADAPFAMAGRLSARRGSEGIAANFAWTHDGALDRIDFASPLGQVVARLEGDATGVRVERPGGESGVYPDWSTLTTTQFGVTIPVDGLSSWIRGAARPGAAFSLERDTQGRPLVLRQQAWEIVYAYPDELADARPSRVTLRYPDSPPVEVRIVVDRWGGADAMP